MDSPISWVGGKSLSVKKIVELMPEHHCYCESFFGAGWIFFSKPRAKVEVVNDVNGELVNLWRILQSKPEEFKERGKYFLYAREFYEGYLKDFYEGRHQKMNDVERAFRFFCLIKMAFGAGFSKGWGYGSARNVAESFFNEFKIIDAVTERLRHVQIDNKDFEQLIKDYDREDTLTFCCLPNTKIRMRNEEIKNIQDINIGNITFGGGKVINVMKRDYKGLIYEFEYIGEYDNLHITPDHPLAIIRQNEIYEIKNSHVSKFRNQQSLNNSNVMFKSAKDVHIGDFLLVPCHPESNVIDDAQKSRTKRKIITKENRKFIITPITNIKTYEYNGIVHNITTENKIYIANNIVSHNCDPPYIKSDVDTQYFKSMGANNIIGFTLHDHQRLYIVLKELKGKFILTIDDSPFIRERYCQDEQGSNGFYWIENVVHYSSADKNNRRHATELIITNYDTNEVIKQNKQKNMNKKDKKLNGSSKSLFDF